MAAQVAALPRIIIDLRILTLIHAGNDHRSSGTIQDFHFQLMHTT